MLQQKLVENGIVHRTQVEISVTIADFYLPTEPRPTLVFIDGQMSWASDTHCSNRVRDKLYEMIRSAAKVGVLHG